MTPAPATTAAANRVMLISLLSSFQSPRNTAGVRHLTAPRFYPSVWSPGNDDSDDSSDTNVDAATRRLANRRPRNGYAQALLAPDDAPDRPPRRTQPAPRAHRARGPLLTSRAAAEPTPATAAPQPDPESPPAPAAQGSAARAAQTEFLAEHVFAPQPPPPAAMTPETFETRTLRNVRVSQAAILQKNLHTIDPVVVQTVARENAWESDSADPAAPIMLLKRHILVALLQHNAPAQDVVLQPLRQSGARVHIPSFCPGDPPLPVQCRFILDENTGEIYNIINRAENPVPAGYAAAEAARSSPIAVPQEFTLFTSTDAIVDRFWPHAAALMHPTKTYACSLPDPTAPALANDDDDDVVFVAARSTPSPQDPQPALTTSSEIDPSANTLSAAEDDSSAEGDASDPESFYSIGSSEIDLSNDANDADDADDNTSAENAAAHSALTTATHSPDASPASRASTAPDRTARAYDAQSSGDDEPVVSNLVLQQRAPRATVV